MARLPFVPEDWLDGDQQAGAPVIRGKTLFFPFHDLEILGDKNAFSMSFENGPPPELVPGSVSKFIKPVGGDEFFQTRPSSQLVICAWDAAGG